MSFIRQQGTNCCYISFIITSNFSAKYYALLFGFSNMMIFFKSLTVFSSMLHLFDQKYSKDINILK